MIQYPGTKAGRTSSYRAPAMEELREAEQAFLWAIESSSDMPGINDINLAMAAVALLKAEKVAPDSGETCRMRARFARLGRRDVYEAVKAIVEGSQP